MIFRSFGLALALSMPVLVSAQIHKGPGVMLGAVQDWGVSVVMFADGIRYRVFTPIGAAKEHFIADMPGSECSSLFLSLNLRHAPKLDEQFEDTILLSIKDKKVIAHVTVTTKGQYTVIGIDSTDMLDLSSALAGGGILKLEWKSSNWSFNIDALPAAYSLAREHCSKGVSV